MRNSLKNVCRLIDQSQENISPEQSFLSDLKRTIELENDKYSRKPSQSYKPSSLGCIRSMYYQRIGADVQESKSSYTSVGICNSGSDIHVRIQSAVESMKDHGIDCEYVDVADFVAQRGLTYLTIVSKNGMETKLYWDDMKLSFLCDGVIRYKGHYYILELKTETSYKWNQRKFVDEGHYNQGTAYSIALGLPEVLFIYINRDILDMKSYLFVPTDEQKDALLDKIRVCERYVSLGNCPPKPENMTKKSCSYCLYKERCNKEV